MPIKAPPLRLKDGEKILAMLLPSQLTAPENFFIEEEDLDAKFELKDP